MTKVIELMFHANYNGWSASCDGEELESVYEALPDVTVDWSDEEGRYMYGRHQLMPDHEEKIRAVVSELYPDHTVEIEFDNCSS